MISISHPFADPLIQRSDLGQQRFVGKVRGICKGNKHIRKDPGSKYSERCTCKLFVHNIQNLISKGISIFIVDIMKIFDICGDQGKGMGISGTFLDLPYLFGKSL